MSVHFVTGKPGNGKGLVLMDLIRKELKNGDRPIITNLPVHIEPWIRKFKKGRKWVYKPEIGLRNYLLERHGEDFDCDKRVFVVEDSVMSEFFLWRVIDGKLVKIDDHPTRDKGKIVAYDTTLALKHGGVVYMTDEAWKFYGARDWQDTGKGLQYYAAQHRHFGDDWYIATQHTKQVDTAFRILAQDFWVVTNHSKKRMGFFRQPDIFSVSVYSDPPLSKNDTPMNRSIFRIDKPGIGGCYDTAAGTGVSGSGGADILEKKKGLPAWGIVVALILGGLAVIGVARGAGSFVGHLLTGTTGKQVTKIMSSNSNQTQVAKSPELLRSNSTPHVVYQSEFALTNRAPEVYCTGMFYTGKQMLVCLSDGEVVSDSARITRVFNDGAVIDGKFYKIKPVKTETKYERQSVLNYRYIAN